MTKKILVDTVSSLTGNTDLALEAAGSGVVNIEAGFKVGGTVGVPQASIQDQAINEAKLQVSNAPVNGYNLTAQSGNTGGLTWAEASGGGLEYFRAAMGGDQSIPQNTVTKLVFNSEVYDTASKYDPSTNYRWTPASGAVFIHAQIQMNINVNVINQLMLYKNGSEIHTSAYKQYSGATTTNLSFISTCNGSDYFELYYHHNDSGAESLQANDSTFFGMVIA